MWRLLLKVAALGFLFPGAARADSAVFQLTGDYLGVNTTADQVAGASYSRRYVNPAVLSLGAGTVLGAFYFGARYEAWFAGRTFTLGTATQTDTLRYQTIGLEAGFYGRNPRVIYLATFGVHYPLTLSVASAGGSQPGTYAASGSPLTYALRVGLGLRVFQMIFVLFEGGYRFADLGNLASAGTPYLSSSFDLSGAFAGIGLGARF